MKRLFKIEGFAPFVIVLFLNATVDLAHKITIQNTLLKSFEGETLIILSALINALILLPFIALFSASGYLNDRFSKTVIVRVGAISAVLITLLITLSYYQGWFIVAFLLTLALAIQSAIYSPAKYGLIKSLVGVDRLGAANGVVQAVTIVAILFSSLAFSVLFEISFDNQHSPSEILQQIAPLGWIFVALSVIESYFAFKLPLFAPESQKSLFSIKKYVTLGYLRSNTKTLFVDKNIWLSILGLSIFWGVSQLVVSVFPAHYKAMSGDDNVVIIQAILAVSAIGLVLGSMIVARRSQHHIDLGMVPIGAVGLFISLVLFALSENVTTMMLSSLLFGLSGGLFIVPLNASIQFFSPAKKIGKILAGNNFVQNIFMTLFLALSIAFVQIGLTTTQMLILASLIALFGSLYTIKKLPHFFTSLLTLPILKSRYKISADGLENLPQTGGVLLLGNHTSWLDWIVLQLASPRAVTYVMHKSYYDLWYLSWFFKIYKAIPISPERSKDAIVAIRERLDKGEAVVLFPEGRISYNGQLSEFSRGFELSIKKTSYPIVPFYIRGLWGSSFSRANTHFKHSSRGSRKRDVSVTFGKALSSKTTAKELKQKIQQLSFESWDSFIDREKPFHYSWLQSVKRSLKKEAVVDGLGVSLSSAKLLISTLMFAKSLKNILADKKSVAVVLESSSMAIIINLALMILGKKVVNIDHNQSLKKVQNCFKKCAIEAVIVDKNTDLWEGFGVDFITVESIESGFRECDRVCIGAQVYLAPCWLIRLLHFKKTTLDHSAIVVLDGDKNIELTHKNIVASIREVSELLNFEQDDVVFSSLPMSSSFGLIVSTLLPLSQGVVLSRTSQSRSALDIGKMASTNSATILILTQQHYDECADEQRLHPLMFKDVRVALLSADGKQSVGDVKFKERFNIEVYKSLGVEECCCVVSTNMPDLLEGDTFKPLIFNKTDTVGLPYPGTVVKVLDPVTLRELGFDEIGVVAVSGAQVMRGYCDDIDKTKEVFVELSNKRYFKSSKRGSIDEDGFVTIHT